MMDKFKYFFSAGTLLFGSVTLIGLAFGGTTNAQDDLPLQAKWSPSSDQQPLIQTDLAHNCDGVAPALDNTYPLRYGVSYKLKNEHPTILDYTRSLFANPSETVAQRELYALDVASMSSEDWTNVANKAATQSDKNLRLSVILDTDDGLIATPIKWDPNATSAISETIRLSEESGLKQNEVAKAFASKVVASSLDTFEDPSLTVSQEIKQDAKATYYFCGRQVGTGGLLVDRKVYVGVSFDPGLQHVAAKPVTTIGGVAGERLGTDIPSWPYIE